MVGQRLAEVVGDRKIVIPVGCPGMETDITNFLAARSITSTAPGSVPTDSLDTNARRLSGE
jgi:hypothetical protein